MKKFLLATAAVVALAAPAVAADLAPRPYTKAPAYVPAPIYNWTGFYIGGHIGGAFGGSNGVGALGGNSDGKFLGGIQGGADYQFASNWVLGIEAQYSWLGSSSRETVLLPGFVYVRDHKGIGSVTGRLGYTWGPALLYVKGGWAYADRSEEVYFNGAAYGLDRSRDGYTVGAGLEYLFTQNWSGKIEYQYYDFGKTNFDRDLIAFGSHRNDEHTVKAGINYRFNLGGPIATAF